jgi:TrmH family RNA methyltransferase
MILIDDEENIIQALDAGVQIHSLYYSGGQVLSQQLIQILSPHTIIYEVAKRTCKKLFENDKVSRVFAIAHTPTTLSLNSLQDISRDIVALEDLTISGNIGAIVRTAVAFGIGGIVLLNANPVDVYDRRLIRASRAYIFSLPVITATTDEFIRFCKDKGFSLTIMDTQADYLVQEAVTLSNRFAIVFGSEKDGCSQVLQDAAMLQVQIPMSSRVESLNVSTPAAIMLYNRSWFNTPQVRK